MYSETSFRLAATQRERRAVFSSKPFHALSHPPPPPRALSALGALILSAGNANLPIGVEMPSALTFRLLTAFFSHSSASPKESPLYFHILTNSFSRNFLPLIFLQIAGGYGPVARQIVEPILEPKLANSNAGKHSSCPRSFGIRCVKSPLGPEHRRRQRRLRRPLHAPSREICYHAGAAAPGVILSPR